MDWPAKRRGLRPFAAQIKNQYTAKLHHAKNAEIMKQCDRMTDTPGVDWAEVAALRGVTVTLDGCVKASAGLAAEFGK